MSQKKVTGTPAFTHCQKWIFFPASSSFAITTTLAVEPIGDIFPPNHTPNTRAHQRILTPETH